MFSLRGIYERVGFRKLMLIHIIIVLAAVGINFYYFSQNGEWFSRSIDLRGGVQLTVDNVDADIVALENHLSQYFSDVRVRSLTSIGGGGILVEAGEDITESQMIDAMTEFGIEPISYSFQEVGSSLSAGFWEQSQKAFILAFIFMGIITFLLFRSIAPSVGVMQAVISDLIITIAIMNILGLEISLASFAALLLVVGYSIDTDILLTNRVLKREGNFIEKADSAAKTGLTMTSTSLVAVTVIFLTASNAAALRDISSTLMIALVADLTATWFMNVGILHWWVNKKK